MNRPQCAQSWCRSLRVMWFLFLFWCASALPAQPLLGPSLSNPTDLQFGRRTISYVAVEPDLAHYIDQLPQDFTSKLEFQEGHHGARHLTISRDDWTSPSLRNPDAKTNALRTVIASALGVGFVVELRLQAPRFVTDDAMATTVNTVLGPARDMMIKPLVRVEGTSAECRTLITAVRQTWPDAAVGAMNPDAETAAMADYHVIDFARTPDIARQYSAAFWRHTLGGKPVIFVSNKADFARDVFLLATGAAGFDYSSAPPPVMASETYESLAVAQFLEFVPGMRMTYQPDWSRIDGDGTGVGFLMPTGSVVSLIPAAYPKTLQNQAEATRRKSASAKLSELVVGRGKSLITARFDALSGDLALRAPVPLDGADAARPLNVAPTDAKTPSRPGAVVRYFLTQSADSETTISDIRNVP